MIINVTETMFHNEFNDIRPDNFSFEARKELFSHYWDLEADTGERIELDVIAICCDWVEDTPESIFNNYKSSLDLSFTTYHSDNKEELVDAMFEHTCPIELDNGNILFQVW